MTPSIIFAPDGVMAYRRYTAHPRGGQKNKAGHMKYVYQALLVLVLIGFAALSGYSYFGDLSQTQSQVSMPVKINVN